MVGSNRWVGVQVARRTQDGGFEAVDGEERCLCGRESLVVAVAGDVRLCKGCLTEAVNVIDSTLIKMMVVEGRKGNVQG